MYTFVKITNYYQKFLAASYALRGEIVSASYQEQLEFLLGQRFGWSDFYRRNLQKLGVDAHEMIANALPLQRAWASEHGITGSVEQILFAQLAEIKPTVVFLQDSIRFGGRWIDELRRRVPSVKLVIGWYCSPMNETQELALKGCDFVMCCSPLFVEKLLRRGIIAYDLPHAFEPSILQEMQNNSYPFVDFIFIGSILSGTGFHGLRQQILDRLIEAGIDLTMHANVEQLSFSNLWLRRLAYVSAQTFRMVRLERVARSLPYLKKGLLLNEYPQTLKGIKAIARRAQVPIYGIEMFKALAHSLMALNYHGDVAGAYASNIRLFEVTGVGSCLVTDWKKNISEFFDPENEIVTFRSADECIEKVHWLLNHQAECRIIAARGHQRTLRHHTYYNRAEQLHEIILKHMR